MTRPTEPSGAATPRGWRRVGWFLLLWVGGVAAVGGLAYALKALLGFL